MPPLTHAGGGGGMWLHWPGHHFLPLSLSLLSHCPCVPLIPHCHPHHIPIVLSWLLLGHSLHHSTHCPPCEQLLAAVWAGAGCWVPLLSSLSLCGPTIVLLLSCCHSGLMPLWLGGGIGVSLPFSDTLTHPTSSCS